MTQVPGQFSPDGQWRWDGQRWLPAHGPGAPGPTPPKQSRTPWIVGGAAVVVLALVAVLVIVLSSSDDSGKEASPDPSSSKSEEPAGPEIAPVQCAANTAAGCFPNISISRDLLPALQSQGFSCADDGRYAKLCSKRLGDADRSQLSVSLKFNSREPDKLAEVSAAGSAGTIGNNPPDKSAMGNQRTAEALEVALKLVFPTAQRTQGEIVGWAKQTLGNCPRTLSTHKVFSGFEVRCTNSTPPVAVGAPEGTHTTWTGIVNVAAPGLMRQPPPGPS